MKKIYIAFLTLISIFLLSGCIGLKSPDIAYQDTQLKFTSFNSAKAVFNFNISNENMVPLNGIINYSLKVSGKKLFSGNSSPIEVGSKSTSEFSLETEINFATFFSNAAFLISEIQKGNKSLPFEINGAFETKVSGVKLSTPINTKGDLPLPDLNELVAQGFSLIN